MDDGCTDNRTLREQLAADATFYSLGSIFGFMIGVAIACLIVLLWWPAGVAFGALVVRTCWWMSCEADRIERKLRYNL